MAANLDDVRVFAAVARAGGFREASRVSGTSASSASEAVRRLESGLGVRLLHRTTRSVAPTEAGARLLERLGPALGEIGAALESVKTLGDRPAGTLRLFGDGVVRDSGLPDVVAPSAPQHAVEDLPADTIAYLLGSRYCETDRLSQQAWQLFGGTPPGWARVQAICDYVHRHITFGYQHARATKTAWEAFTEGTGVCRDYAHLAIAFCSAMNIPARYCTGYMGDIGIPPDPAPMDFSGWFEAYLLGQWYTFDARHVVPRIGRIVMATGRDAADVALSTSFGRMDLVKFLVISDEVVAA